jgi:hypothetical protein
MTTRFLSLFVLVLCPTLLVVMSTFLSVGVLTDTIQDLLDVPPVWADESALWNRLYSRAAASWVRSPLAGCVCVLYHATLCSIWFRCDMY